MVFYYLAKQAPATRPLSVLPVTRGPWPHSVLAGGPFLHPPLDRVFVPRVCARFLNPKRVGLGPFVSPVRPIVYASLYLVCSTVSTKFFSASVIVI